MKVKTEVFDEATPLGDIVTFLDPLEGAVSEEVARRFHDYPLNPGETSSEYIIRVCSDLLTNYYNLQDFESPFSFNEGPSVQGFKFHLESPGFPALDFICRVPREHEPETLGCIFVVFPSVQDPFRLDLELSNFFTILPRVCTWDPWTISSLQASQKPIFLSKI